MMKSKKLISAILAVASIAGGVVGAQASEFELNLKIESEAQARVANDNLLNKEIEDNKTAIDATAKIAEINFLLFIIPIPPNVNAF